MARRSGEQTAFSAVAFHTKQLPSSLLSPSKAESLVRITPNAPKPSRAEVGQCVSWSCTSFKGSSPENKKHKFPVPSAGGSTALIPKFWGLPGGQQAAGWVSVTHGLPRPLCDSRAWHRDPEAHLPVHRGSQGTKPFCRSMCALVCCRNLGSTMMWPWPSPNYQHGANRRRELYTWGNPA